MSTLFISYRRSDTEGEAGRLYDRLRARFGDAAVFRDVDAIEPGRRFPREIEARLADCAALVALIGPRWAGGAGETGLPRIQDPGDYVRLEIAAALRKGVPVIPALVRGASMPSPAALPPDLQELAECQAVELDDADFHADADRLAAALERTGRFPGRLERTLAAWTGPGRRRTLGVLGVAGLAAAAVSLLRAGDAPELRSRPATLSPEEVRAVIVEKGFFSAASNPGAAGPRHRYRAELAERLPVVVDAAAGLVWERGGSRDIVPGGREGAALRVREMNARRAGGHDDWRLPTVEEALSLLTPAAAGGLHLDPAFDGAAAPFVWTADGAVGGGGWVVYYADGFAAEEGAAFSAYVRAVRAR